MRSFLGVLLLALAAHSAASQSQTAAPADSSASAGGGLLRAIAIADSAVTDSLSAAAATLAAVPAGVFGPWNRTVSFTVDADVTLLSGKTELAVASNGGDIGTNAAFSRTENNYRRQDRDATLSTLGAGAFGVIPQLASLRFDLNRSTMDDESRTKIRNRSNTADSTLVFAIENETRDARLGLSGSRDLHGPFGVAWALRGGYFEREGSNQGTVQALDRFERGGSGRWRYARGPTTVVAKFGYLALDGNNALRGTEGDLSARQDTVGTRLDLNFGSKFVLNIDVDRSSFDERRLDFRRNSTGVVDTLDVGANQAIVDRERERSVIDRVAFDLSSQLLPILSLNTNYTQSFEDREFSFSQEGRVRDNRLRMQNTLTLDYLDSGRATLGFVYGNSWFNRRSLSDASFRGRKFNKDYELRLTVNQALMEALSLRLTLTQDLSQIIPTDPSDRDDRDTFSEIADGQLKADPFESLTLTVNGTVKRTDTINVSANRVGENREDRLFDVRGGYAWHVSRKIHLEQVYRMEILFKDFHQDDDRDQFNKSGHLNTSLKWSTLGKDGRSDDGKLPVVELRHEFDFREAGSRDVGLNPFASIYSRSLRKYDHLLRGTLSVPWRGFAARVVSEHGLILEKNPSTGIEKEDKDYGSVRYQLSGNRGFRRGLVNVKLDVTRVVQYGDYIRKEQQRFWEAASTVTVNF
jgi:hypothetical protein